MPRLRDLGIAVGSLPAGPLNAITDVAGVRVGHTTLIEGDSVRTGVTVIQPRAGSVRETPVFAAASTLNGNGEMTGLEWVRESGLLTTPVAITNTHSVGVVRDALVADDVRRAAAGTFWSMPVVAETWDGLLNDVDGQHVTREHALAALAAAASGPVAEGGVGGGTGMVSFGFKGGIGTSSRVAGDWTVGVLVQANHGRREDLRVAGAPVGERIPVEEVPAPADDLPRGSGSIIVVVATDAPLLADQCRRLAVRGGVGVGRGGGGDADSSGDIVLAFATGNDAVPPEWYADAPPVFGVESVPHQRLDPLLKATVDATEEAILNALLGAETMTGRGGNTARALEPERLLAALA